MLQRLTDRLTDIYTHTLYMYASIYIYICPYQAAIVIYFNFCILLPFRAQIAGNHMQKSSSGTATRRRLQNE